MTYLERIALGLLLAACAACTRWDQPDAGPGRPGAPAGGERAARVTGSGFLGASVRTPDGNDDWRVDELLYARGSGAIAGVVLARDGEDGPVRTVVEHDALDWRVTDTVSASLIGDGPVAPDRGDLFEGLGRSFVEGRITQVQPVPGSVPRTVVIKVHDDENLLHRVLVEPAILVEGSNLSLAEGRRVGARGVLTRDATGKLLIADELTQNRLPVVLRDADGAIAWDVLIEPFGRASRLKGDTVLAPNDVELRVVDWTLDTARGALDELHVVNRNWTFALPWHALLPTDDAHTWRTKREAASLDVVAESAGPDA